MEMKVWVEGLSKTICGVNKETTCQDIIKTLAHATGKRGKFVLVERWGQAEKPLAPTDHLLNMLQQKGEYWHTVQFILRKVDPAVLGTASTAESPSPLPPPSTCEIPFQRGGRGSTLRKSLTSHGGELTVPKIMRTRGSVLMEHNSQVPTPVKENNFPSDLTHVPLHSYSTVGKAKESNNGAQKAPLVPVIPYGSDVSLQSETGLRSFRNGHIRQSSLDDQQYRAAHNLTHGNGILLESKNVARAVEIKLNERKKQLTTEIRQQKEQMAHTQADELHFDRELLSWEEKTEKISREVESVEASLQPLRSSESKVIANLKELSQLQLEDLLRTNRKLEESTKAEIVFIRSRVNELQDTITRTEAKARAISEQIRGERDNKPKDGYSPAVELALKEEHDRLAKELQQLAVIQANQSRRFDDSSLNEQRIDSTLLAKQLELDSLQGLLKKANFDGFLGALPAKSLPALSPDALLESEELANSENPEVDAGSQEIHPPAALTRRALSSQRILVLKRNSTRDPQGMWV